MNVKKQSSSYATVTEDEGDNYREIAEIMTNLGYEMNHSTARNYVVKTMKTFAEEVYKKYLNISLDEISSNRIARDPYFQSAMADILQLIEVKRRDLDS